MPCVAHLLTTSIAVDPDSRPVEFAEAMPLYFLSSLPVDLRQSPGLSAIIRKECGLHIAQADDALADVCHQR